MVEGRNQEVGGVMRKPKFRYRIELEKGIIKFFTFDILQIEAHKGLKTLKSKILSRDEYTGLKDKSGTEICENDKCLYENKAGKHIGIVKYREKYTAFRLQFEDAPYQGFWHDLENVEVIGNIWEDK